MALNGYLVRGHMKFYDVEPNTTSTATSTSTASTQTPLHSQTMEEYIRYVKNGTLIDKKDKFIGNVLSKHCEEVKNEIILKKHDIEYDYYFCRDALSNLLFDLTVLSTKMGFTLEELMEVKMDKQIPLHIRNKM
jgi:hypothetical protein